MTIRQSAGFDPMHQTICLCGWTRATPEDASAQTEAEVWIKQKVWFGFDTACQEGDTTAAVKVMLVDGKLKFFPISVCEFFQL